MPDLQRLHRHLVAAVLLLAATPAAAAPVSGTASLSIRVADWATFTFSGSATVDVSGSTIAMAPFSLSQGPTVTIPATGSTAIQSLRAVGIANLGGTFSLGGLTNQLPGEVCTGAAPGSACNAGGGIGGAMGITGGIRLLIIPDASPLLDLGQLGIGQGGAMVTTLITVDNAGFTTGRAFVRTNDSSQGSRQLTMTGGVTPQGRLSLVSPTFLDPGVPLPVRTTLVLPIPEPSTLLLLGGGLAALGASVSPGGVSRRSGPRARKRC